MLTLFSSLCLPAAPEDTRPPLNKTDHKKTVWAQVNPWFPMNKQPVHDYGGPNIAWIHHEGENIWGQGMKLCEKYGLDGWYLEINEPGGWIATYQKLLKEAEAVGAKTRIGLFYGFYSKTAEESLKAAVKGLEPLRNALKDHPNVARIDGRPVLMVYNTVKYQPEEWKFIFDGLEKEFGSMVFLFNYRSLTHKGDFEENIRRYLPVFDGVSNYGSAGTDYQKRCAAVLEKVMKNEFPQKLYEAGVHSTYTCHFHMGGLEVDLSRKYRDSFEIYLKTNPDSLNITNLFDHYENSLIYPCYEREDFMLRYMQYRLSLWRNTPFPKSSRPELVVTNHVQILLGRQDLEFEVIGFPIESSRKTVRIMLDLCDTSGKVLHTFPAKNWELDQFRVERFSVSSLQYADQRAVVPRLRYEWKGKKYQMNHGPMTLISPSIRSYRMYWARSTKNELETTGNKEWTLAGKKPGETYIPGQTGIAGFSSDLSNTWKDHDRSGYLRHGIKYDGLEFYFTRNDRTRLRSNLALVLPPPGDALHYFHLEIENDKGRRLQTLPVWVTNGRRAQKVKVPILTQDGSVQEFLIEGARVPYFYYPCSEDTQNLLVDHSGYMHNGAVNGTGFGGGHLGYTGYNYYHNGPVAPLEKGQFSLFRRGKDERGFLHFSGKDHIMIMGGTAFPGAFTYELSVRPASLGKVMGLIGSGNNQIAIRLLSDGRIEASRKSEVEGMGGSPRKRNFTSRVVSETKARTGEWTRIAVVYDLRKLKLYLNDRLEGESGSIPAAGHDWINHLIVGASNKWVFQPVEKFHGDIREIRFYGRNLEPSEFLK